MRRLALAYNVVTLPLLVLPSLLVFSVREVHSPGVFAGTGLMVVLLTVWLGQLSADGVFRPVTAAFVLFCYVFLGLVPLLQGATGRLPWYGATLDEFSTSELTWAYASIVLGVAAFYFGARRARQREAQRAPEEMRFASRILVKSRVRLFSVAGLLATGIAVWYVGGFGTLFVSRDERAEIIWGATSGFGQVFFQFTDAVIRIPAFLSLVMLIALSQSRKVEPTQGVNVFDRGLLVLCALVCIVVNNPVSNARYWVGTVVLTLAFLLFRYGRVGQRAMLMLGIVFGLIVVFPYADLFREETSASLGERLADTSIVRELSENGDYDAFQQILNGVDYVGDNGFEFGRQLVGTALFWFPRPLWSGKPVPTGEMVAGHAGFDFTNLSMPLWGEFYVDGGVILVVVGFLIYGWIVGSAEMRLARAGQVNRATLAAVLVPIWAGYQFFLLRGSLMSAVAYITPVIVAAWICSVRSKAVDQVARSRRGARRSIPLQFPHNLR